MNEPPKMLSNKDVMYISDILNIQYVLVKKLKKYEEDLEDIKIVNLISKTHTMLSNGYDSLMEALNE